MPSPPPSLSKAESWAQAQDFSSDFRSGSQFDYDLADARSLKSFETCPKHEWTSSHKKEELEKQSLEPLHFTDEQTEARGSTGGAGGQCELTHVGVSICPLAGPGPWAMSFHGPGPLSPCVSNDKALPPSQSYRNQKQGLWSLSRGPGLEEEQDSR